jgi:crossover junction endodeoxyribonuclease RuvC
MAAADSIMRVLGIDPGTRITGYGVVEKQENKLVHLMHGEVKPSNSAPLSTCLVTIYDQLVDVVEQTTPDAVAIEDIFYGKNVRSLIKQSETRGVAILVGSHKRIPVFEYAPLEIKKAVVGYGRAEKNQMRYMVKAILQLSELPPPDAADALAIAICHAHFLKVLSI